MRTRKWVGVNALAPADCFITLSLSLSLCVPFLNSAGHHCASKHYVSPRLARAREKRKICLERNAKGGLGLALPRGKRGGATFSRLRGDPFFFPSKVELFSLCYFIFFSRCGAFVVTHCYYIAVWSLFLRRLQSRTACAILLTDATFNIERR